MDASGAGPPVIGVRTGVSRRAWREAVEGDGAALADHTPEWAGAITAGGRWVDVSRLYHLDDGSHVVLPLFRRRRVPTWLASPPRSWGFGGLVGPRSRDPVVIEAVVAHLAGLRSLRARIRPHPLQGAAWAAVCASARVRLVMSRAHVIDLRRDPATMLAGMKKETRRHIRRTEALGLDIRVGSSPDLIEAYHGLRRLSVGRWAEHSNEPAWLAHRRDAWKEPVGRTQALAARLGDRLRVQVAWLDGTPVAATVVALGRSAHATRSAIDRERLGGLGLMPYLDWLSIQDAHAEGCTWFHLGDTGGSTSLATYKESLGAVSYPYPEVCFETLPITAADAAARRLVRRTLGVASVPGPGGEPT